MLDHPEAAALLEVARRTLVDEVAAALDGRARYVALMVANAMGIAAREIEHGARAAQAWDEVGRAGARDGQGETSLGALVAAIRAGVHDGDTAVYEALLAATAITADIWKPPVRPATQP